MHSFFPFFFLSQTSKTSQKAKGSKFLISKTTVDPQALNLEPRGWGGGGMESSTCVQPLCLLAAKVDHSFQDESPLHSTPLHPTPLPKRSSTPLYHRLHPSIILLFPFQSSLFLVPEVCFCFSPSLFTSAQWMPRKNLQQQQQQQQQYRAPSPQPEKKNPSDPREPVAQ